ncbi:ankyrin repeat domain-containing protein [Candidatus Gracilibacteria bacterium]|nr:ankyrin repeat domain-containing protein [Candidatus Gracilibacteria bacterium]
MTSNNELLLQQIKAGNTLEVQRLLNKQCDVNYADHHGHTALAWAIIKNRTEMVKVLINANADVNCAGHHRTHPSILGSNQ